MSVRSVFSGSTSTSIAGSRTIGSGANGVGWRGIGGPAGRGATAAIGCGGVARMNGVLVSAGGLGRRHRDDDRRCLHRGELERGESDARRLRGYAVIGLRRPRERRDSERRLGAGRLGGSDTAGTEASVVFGSTRTPALPAGTPTGGVGFGAGTPPTGVARIGATSSSGSGLGFASTPTGGVIGLITGTCADGVLGRINAGGVVGGLGPRPVVGIDGMTNLPSPLRLSSLVSPVDAAANVDVSPISTHSASAFAASIRPPVAGGTGTRLGGNLAPAAAARSAAPASSRVGPSRARRSPSCSVRRARST